jgi:tripartite-type tricarboxylate transporter receptor subunit TctC
MPFPFRQRLFAVLLLTASAAASAADAFPSRPIRIIVNSAAGALLDVTTRVIAQQMSDNLGQPIIVENRTGADGMIGIRAVKTAAPDGYTILATANTLAQLPAFKKEPGYDPAKDFVGVGIMSQAPFIMVGAPSLPSKNLAELIARAKASPDKMQYASGGFGTSTHMAAALFLHQAGIRMLHVPYKGNAGAMPDVISGREDFIFDGANTAIANVKAGKLRAFGITSPKRSPAFPDIPTLAEQGLPDYSFHVWLGLAAPAGTPKDVVQRLAQALHFAQGTAPVRDRLSKDGAEAGTLSPEEFTKFVRDDMERTMKVATDLGIPKE